jgi:hypothetical protein
MRSTAPERSKGARWGFTFSRSMMLPPSLQPSPMRCLPRQGDGERRCTMSALRNINTESRDSASDPEAAIAGGKCDRQAAGDRPLQRLRGTEGGLMPCFFLAWTYNRRHHQPMKASPYVRARANTQAFPPNRPVPCEHGTRHRRGPIGLADRHSVNKSQIFSNMSTAPDPSSLRPQLSCRPQSSPVKHRQALAGAARAYWRVWSQEPDW